MLTIHYTKQFFSMVAINKGNKITDNYYSDKAYNKQTTRLKVIIVMKSL